MGKIFLDTASKTGPDAARNIYSTRETTSIIKWNTIKYLDC